MKVWVLLQQESETGDAGYVVDVFATKAAAETAESACIDQVLADGYAVYYNPRTDTTTDDWDRDFVIEEHEVRE